MAPALEVVCDDRERESGVPEALRREGIPARTERLPLGDYRVGDLLLVERKRLPDFAASIVDGRLFRQAARLARFPGRVAFVLEGTLKDWEGVGVSRESAQGALVTLTMVFGLAVWRARDAAETARLIRFAAEQAGRRLAGRVGRPGYRPRGLERRKRFVLQGLPGIGPARAAALLDRFGSVSRALSASESELAGVPGLGRRTAAGIRRIVSEAAACYFTRAGRGSRRRRGPP